MRPQAPLYIQINMIKKFKKTNKGYTLVELLGVVVIILIFSTILLSSNRNATQSANSVTYQQQKRELQTALEGWVAVQPSLAVASTSWPNTLEGVLTNAGKMLSHSSRDTFRVEGGTIITGASQAMDKGFEVSWDNTGSGRRRQGPIVSEVDL